MIKTLQFYGAEVKRESPNVELIWERFFQRSFDADKEFMLEFALSSNLGQESLSVSELFYANDANVNRWFARMIYSHIVEPDRDKIVEKFVAATAGIDKSLLRHLVFYDTETLSVFSYNKYAMAVFQGVLHLMRIRVKRIDMNATEFMGLPISDRMRRLYDLKMRNSAKLDHISRSNLLDLVKTLVPTYVWEHHALPTVRIENANTIVVKFKDDFFGVRDCAAKLVNQRLGNVYIDQAIVNFSDIQVYVRNCDGR